MRMSGVEGQGELTGWERRQPALRWGAQSGYECSSAVNKWVGSMMSRSRWGHWNRQWKWLWGNYGRGETVPMQRSGWIGGWGWSYTWFTERNRLVLILDVGASKMVPAEAWRHHGEAGKDKTKLWNLISHKTFWWILGTHSLSFRWCSTIHLYCKNVSTCLFQQRSIPVGQVRRCVACSGLCEMGGGVGRWLMARWVRGGAGHYMAGWSVACLIGRLDWAR